MNEEGKAYADYFASAEAKELQKPSECLARPGPYLGNRMSQVFIAGMEAGKKIAIDRLKAEVERIGQGRLHP